MSQKEIITVCMNCHKQISILKEIPDEITVKVTLKIKETFQENNGIFPNVMLISGFYNIYQP